MGMALPIPLPLNDVNMLRVIRKIAKDTSKVFILPHAKKRMKQRKITQTQVYEWLRKCSESKSTSARLRGKDSTAALYTFT